MAALAARQQAVAGMSARVRATSWLGGERVRATVNMLVERDGHLRFEAEVSLQGTVATLATDGATFALLDARKNELSRGPACPANVASLIRIPLAPAEVAAILLGDARLPEAANVEARRSSGGMLGSAPMRSRCGIAPGERCSCSSRAKAPRASWSRPRGWAPTGRRSGGRRTRISRRSLGSACRARSSSPSAAPASTTASRSASRTARSTGAAAERVHARAAARRGGERCRLQRRALIFGAGVAPESEF